MSVSDDGALRDARAMDRYQLEGLEILFDCAGRDDWGKFSFPVWYGIPVKMNWRGYRYDFNLRGGLKRVSGGTGVWPDPQEVLKRTDGNDLIYYGVHGYESSYDLIKNYYVPFNGIYDSDLFDENPLEGFPVRCALDTFDQLTVEAGRLKEFYGDDLINYNSLMLGQNDALAAGGDLLVGAAGMAHELLNLSASYHRGRPNLFLFGSVDSFLEADHALLDRLERLPYRTSINVGMESFDQETLDRLGKPLRAERVREAFRKMVAVNRSWPNIAVSCNLALMSNSAVHQKARTTPISSSTIPGKNL